MGLQAVCGITEDEIEELRAEFSEKPAAQWYDFEDRYCLYKIPRQPEDYDGPPRWCQKTAQGEANYNRCHVHKTMGRPNPQNLDKLGAMKHGMYATDEHLLESLEEDEIELYNEVLSWAETYYIDPVEDPSVWDDLQMMAVERVRIYRTSKWMLAEGETREKPIFDAEGNYVDDEDAPNVLSEEHRRLKSMVMSLKRDLGLTRKERMKQDGLDNISESAERLSETMSELVQGSDKSYDPDNYEYEAESGD